MTAGNGLPLVVQFGQTLALLYREKTHYSTRWSLRMWKFDVKAKTMHVDQGADVELDDTMVALAQPHMSLRDHLRSALAPFGGPFVIDELLRRADPDNMQVGDERFLDGTLYKWPATGGVVAPATKCTCAAPKGAAHNPGCPLAMAPNSYSSVPLPAPKKHGVCPYCLSIKGGCSHCNASQIPTSVAVPRGFVTEAEKKVIDAANRKHLSTAPNKVAKTPCAECHDTGFYESPLTGARSPCTAGCDPLLSP